MVGLHFKLFFNLLSNFLVFLELLMEEFRIAHQRMFGGKENNGTLLGKIRQQKTSSNDSSTPNDNSTTNSTATSVDPPKNKETMTRVVQSSSGKNTSKLPVSVLPSTRSAKQSNNRNEGEPSSGSNSANNRITIKVLSPKLGT